MHFNLLTLVLLPLTAVIAHPVASVEAAPILNARSAGAGEATINSLAKRQDPTPTARSNLRPPPPTGGGLLGDGPNSGILGGLTGTTNGLNDVLNSVVQLLNGLLADLGTGAHV